MEKSDFDRLMTRYLSGEISEEEKAKVDAWLDVHKTENKGELDLSREDEDKIFQLITSNISLQEALASFPDIPQKKRWHSGWVIKAAAALAILATVTYATWYLSGRSPGASDSDTRKLILNDGTIVWLDGASKLNYYEKEEGRYAELEGEGLFEVAKDPSHPFHLQCGEATINVVGTSFSVKARHDTVELSVLTGLVQFAVANKVTEPVAAHEKIIYVRNDGMRRAALEERDVQAITAHTEYNMQFESESLESVAKRMSEKFDVTISIEDEKARRCRITADLTDQSLDHALTIITEVLDVTYDKKGKTVTLRGEGCP